MKNKKFAALVIASTAGVSLLHGSNCLRSKKVLAHRALSAENGHFFDWSYGNVYYEVTGHGEPVLLLHDLSASGTSFEWSRIIHQLSLKHTVYSVDLPGCGRSDKSLSVYTSFLYVDFLSEFLNKVIRSRTDLIASNAGCLAALSLCQYDSSRINRILLVNPQTNTPISSVHTGYEQKNTAKKVLGTADKYTRRFPMARKILKKCFDIPVFGTFFYQKHFQSASLRHIMIQNDFFDPQKCTDLFVQSACKGAYMGHSRGRFLESSILFHYMDINLDLALSSLQSSGVSVTVIWGEHASNRLEFTDKIQAVFPDCCFTVIPYAKKWPHYEQPNLFLRAIEQL